jgi:chemotaxis protein methyltransferase CheR
VQEAFDEGGDHERCLRPVFREGVHFMAQDIRNEMPPGPFQIIFCRNLVFTYFEPALQSLLLGRILERLSPGGCLVLGSHEELPQGDWPLARVQEGLPVFRG